MKDKIRGVNTQTIIELEDLSIDSHYGSRYETVSYSKLEQIFEFVKKSGYKSCIDIGSGLGRPLIVAKEKGFNNLFFFKKINRMSPFTTAIVYLKKIQKNL